MAKRVYKKKSTLRQRRDKKKSYNKKGKPTRLIVRGPPGVIFPDVFATKLRSTEVGTWATTPTDYRIIRANGAYDPEYALGGPTPLGFTQLATLYLKYRVKACTIKVTVNNSAASPMYLAAYPEAAPNVPGSLQDILQQRYNKYVIVPSNGGGGSKVLKHYVDINKFMGLKDISDDDTYDLS